MSGLVTAAFSCNDLPIADRLQDVFPRNYEVFFVDGHLTILLVSIGPCIQDCQEPATELGAREQKSLEGAGGV
jgi:hypothetical protein